MFSFNSSEMIILRNLEVSIQLTCPKGQNINVFSKENDVVVFNGRENERINVIASPHPSATVLKRDMDNGLIFALLIQIIAIDVFLCKILWCSISDFLAVIMRI